MIAADTFVSNSALTPATNFEIDLSLTLPGFLEAGKTKFIQETLEDKRFNNGEPTLLLVCEEGIEEFEPEEFSGTKLDSSRFP